MKLTTALYVFFAILGVSAAMLVPIVIYRSGTSGLAFWRTVAAPGPLSAAHAFLEEQCESCHTPNQGIKAAGCITCHAPDALVLGKPSTAFHATIQECRGCHIEHQGVDVRPVRMDHSVLTRVGLRAAHFDLRQGQSAGADVAAIVHYLAGLTGSGPATDSQVLDCASCHSVRDKHVGLFGQQCADCHKTESWKITGFLHPSPKSQECNQCHQAPPSHYMMHFEMMDKGITGQRTARVEQCYLCHQTDSFNNIKGIGWFKHH